MNIAEVVASQPDGTALLFLDFTASDRSWAAAPADHPVLALVDPQAAAGPPWSLADLPGATRRQLIGLAARILSVWCGEASHEPPPVPSEAGPREALPLWMFLLSLYVQMDDLRPESYLETQENVATWRVWLRSLGQRDRPVSEDPWFVSLFGGVGGPYPTGVPVVVPLRRPHVPVERVVPIAAAIVEVARLAARIDGRDVLRIVPVGGRGPLDQVLGRLRGTRADDSPVAVVTALDPVELGFPDARPAVDSGSWEGLFAHPTFVPDGLSGLMGRSRRWCLPSPAEVPGYVSALGEADVTPAVVGPALELPLDLFEGD